MLKEMEECLGCCEEPSVLRRDSFESAHAGTLMETIHMLRRHAVSLAEAIVVAVIARRRQ